MKLKIGTSHWPSAFGLAPFCTFVTHQRGAEAGKIIQLLVLVNFAVLLAKSFASDRLRVIS